ncbi:MAG: hypothetical protein AB1489_32620 [Acidobacteriota bacterium]
MFELCTNKSVQYLVLLIVMVIIGLIVFHYGIKDVTDSLVKSTIESTFHKVDKATEKVVNGVYGTLPVKFEANQGQADPQVKFIARGNSYRLFLKAYEAVLELRNVDQEEEKAEMSTLRMQWVGGSGTAAIEGMGELLVRDNYLVDDDPNRWQTNIPCFARVRYWEIYPGIDMVYYGTEQQLEYDFIVAPGANPKVIRLRFEGAQKVELASNGDLLVTTQNGNWSQRKPFIYQEVYGVKQTVEGRYVIKSENEVGFELDDYDRSKQLVIDPIILE